MAAGLLAILLFVPAPGLGDEPPLTNDDVVALTKSGLPAPVILAKIETSATAFDASVAALVALAEAGVDPEVVRVMTMVAAGLPAERPETGGPDVRDEEVGEETPLEDLELPEGGECGGGIALLQEGGALNRLERQDVDGIPDVDTRIPGLRSDVRTRQRRPTFFLCVPDGALDSTSVYGVAGFSLIRLTREGADRVGADATSEWTSSRAEVATGVFRVESGKELGPGEYALHIYLGDAVWTFGIDE